MGKDKESKVDLTLAENGDETERGNWGNQFDFFLSCLGYAVGLGNVWRFPYLCYKSGGGAFLIPYVIFLFLAGLPLFFLELSLGQYSSLGPNVVFGKMVPLFQGLGYGMLFVTFLVAIYYNMIIAWTLFYTVKSFTTELPWQECGREWNEKQCFRQEQDNLCKNSSSLMTYWNNTCTDVALFCTNNNNTCHGSYTGCDSKPYSFYNASFCINETAVAANEPYYTYVSVKDAVQRTTSSEDYYFNVLLEKSSGWEDYGSIRPHLVLSLLGAWVIVCLCLIKGVKSSGKVVYFTALFPYAVLIILLGKGLTLDGAYDGIKFFITPDVSRLSDAAIWGDAATQIFYSLGPAFGGLITLSSYNKFKNNCQRDACVVALSNCLTSVFAGFVIFSIVGAMAYDLDVSVGDVIKQGPGLAFIAYPEAITRFPAPPVWSILFFVMLITLGLDSQFTMVETLITASLDQFPVVRKKKMFVVVGTCVACFLLALTMCTHGGVYMFTLIDSYSAGWSLLILALTEIIVIHWIYGYHNFAENVEEMLGHKPNIYWQITWRFVSPFVIIAILIFTLIKYQPTTDGDYTYPGWADTMGWLMAFASVLIVPVFFVINYMRFKKEGMTFKEMLKPHKDWGPAYLIEQRKATELQEQNSRKAGATYDNPGFNNPPSYNNAMKDSVTHM